jgi:hypothetical protein
MFSSFVDPVENVSMDSTRVDHVSVNPLLLFSYMLLNHIAISHVSLVTEPEHGDTMSGMRGQMCTPLQQADAPATSEVHSPAYRDVPHLPKYEALPKRRTLPSGSLILVKISLAKSSSSISVGFSNLAILMQFPLVTGRLATKFWSEKHIVVGLLPMTLCSAVQHKQDKLDGS